MVGGKEVEKKEPNVKHRKRVREETKPHKQNARQAKRKAKRKGGETYCNTERDKSHMKKSHTHEPERLDIFSRIILPSHTKKSPKRKNEKGEM